jgi:hypothetical protein
MIRAVRLTTLPQQFAFGFAMYSLMMAGAQGVQPFSSATVVRVENHVTIGSHAGGAERPAMIHDVVQAETYLVTQDDSRAELEFADRSVVRVGQDTVFSFDANSRTLSLEKGTMLFYVPPGSGGGTIKTPSLTAAITGTVAKVSNNLIAVLSGEVKTQWGTVHAGEAIDFLGGNIRIFQFDPSQAMAGHLIAFGGPLPELPEVGGESNKVYKAPDLHGLEVTDVSQTSARFVRPKGTVIVPKPTPQNNGNHPPYP